MSKAQVLKHSVLKGPHSFGDGLATNRSTISGGIDHERPNGRRHIKALVNGASPTGVAELSKTA